MTFSAITYKVVPGHDEEIAEIFRMFRRADSPVLRDTSGEKIGMLLSTGLFLQGDQMVRVIQHDGGTLDDIARHMARQEGVQEAERALAQYLAVPRDTGDVPAFQAHLRRSAMRCIQYRALDNRPATGLAALRYAIKPGHEDEIAEVFSHVRADARPALKNAAGEEVGLIIGVALFVHEDTMIRVVQYEGELEDVANYMAARGARPEMENRLAAFLPEPQPPAPANAEEFLERFHSSTMRQLSMLSIAGLTVPTS